MGALCVAVPVEAEKDEDPLALYPGQFVAGDRRRALVAEEVEDAALGDLFDQMRKDLGPVGDQRDVGAVALVAGPAVGDGVERERDRMMATAWIVPGGACAA